MTSNYCNFKMSKIEKLRQTCSERIPRFREGKKKETKKGTQYTEYLNSESLISIVEKQIDNPIIHNTYL